jgi:AP-4 complex subunit epsilon-1
VRNFGESASRQAEQVILKKEIEKMKAEFPKLELAPKTMPEFITRMLYCEMHGFDVSQFHIIPVKMTQQSNLMNKYSGYNAVAILLHETHELMIMVINSYRKDLLDKVHFLAIIAALTSISRVITVEAVSVLKPFIPELMAFNLFDCDLNPFICVI